MPVLTEEEKKDELYIYLCEKIDQGSLSEEKINTFKEEHEISDQIAKEAMTQAIQDNRELGINHKYYNMLKDIYKKLQTPEISIEEQIAQMGIDELIKRQAEVSERIASLNEAASRGESLDQKGKEKKGKDKLTNIKEVLIEELKLLNKKIKTFSKEEVTTAKIKAKSSADLGKTPKLGTKANRKSQDFSHYQSNEVISFSPDKRDITPTDWNSQEKKKNKSAISNEFRDDPEKHHLDPRMVDNPLEDTKTFKVKFNNAELKATRDTIAQLSNKSRAPTLHGTISYTENEPDGAVKIGFLNQQGMEILKDINNFIATNKPLEALQIKRLKELSRGSALKIIYIAEANHVDENGKLSLSDEVVQQFLELKLPNPKDRELYNYITGQIDSNSINQEEINKKAKELNISKEILDEVIYIIKSDYYNGKKGANLTNDMIKELESIRGITGEPPVATTLESEKEAEKIDGKTKKLEQLATFAIAANGFAGLKNRKNLPKMLKDYQDKVMEKLDEDPNKTLKEITQEIIKEKTIRSDPMAILGRALKDRATDRDLFLKMIEDFSKSQKEGFKDPEKIEISASGKVENKVYKR